MARIFCNIMYLHKFQYIFLLLTILLSGCNFGRQNSNILDLESDNSVETPQKVEKSEIAQQLTALGLIDLHTIDPFFVVDLKYSTTDNFTGQILYDGLTEAYFQPDVAVMLANARRYLLDTLPGANLIIYDAARPLSIQRIMFDVVKNTPFRNYVANPERTGLHNYGAAVDLTIIDANGVPLDMGTPFDFFGRAAGNREKELVAEGLLTPQHVQNRQLLRYVMVKAGFQTISGEWWHFNAFPLNEAKKRYRVIE